MQSFCPFKVPDEKLRKDAIGSLVGTPIRLKKAMTAIIPLFKPIPKPNEGEWLWDHDEDGETYEAYVSRPKNKVDGKRNVIYIVPLEEQIDEEFLKILQKFTEAYFHGMKVRAKKSMDIKKLGAESRLNEYTGKIQYNASQLLKALEKTLPSDAYCLIGVCMSDLYPKDEWNFGTLFNFLK